MDGIIFHLFPSNDNLKQQWISKLNRPDWTPTKYTKICSCHFNDADFIVTKKGLKKLKKGTLPSLKLDLSDIAMLKKLGCSLEPQAMKTTFPHPNAGYEIAVFLDACHMLKLVRNAFENKKRFLDYQGNNIKWSYLIKLNNLQKSQGLHLGNKLKDKHIDFQRQKMKVKLASQLFSNSVADALQLCEKSDETFKNAAATINFIR
ncbi:hypothetical protein evm_000070 [Chilo suppressalis]|nr:hypothetical protein evm_000070 [Chilo suppressalis]